MEGEAEKRVVKVARRRVRILVVGWWRRVSRRVGAWSCSGVCIFNAGLRPAGGFLYICMDGVLVFDLEDSHNATVISETMSIFACGERRIGNP